MAHHIPRVALVFQTKLEENIKVLNAISKYNRNHDQWSAYVDDEAVSAKNPAWLLRQSWDGIISKCDAPGLFEEALKKGIPCLDLSDSPRLTPGIPKIRPDNHAVGKAGATHLIEKGIKTLAFCGFSNEEWSIERRQGFISALIPGCPDPFIIESEYPAHSDPDWDMKETRFILTMLKKLPKPIGIMACNDLRGIQIIAACREAKIQVPEEVAVVGANNESIRCELTNPQLSSIPINAEFYGQKAAQMISSMIKNKSIVENLVLVDPLEVEARRSTDVFSIDDRAVIDALRLVRDNACKGITVEELCTQVHASRSLLERKFRKFLGRSPQAEIRNEQIKRVKQLLIETDYTLSRIAEMCGFAYVEYLCLLFKKTTRMTPKQYRQRFQMIH